MAKLTVWLEWREIDPNTEEVADRYERIDCDSVKHFGFAFGESEIWLDDRVIYHQTDDMPNAMSIGEYGCPNPFPVL